MDIGGDSYVFSQRTFEQFREERTVLTDVCATASLFGVNVKIDDQPESIPWGQVVSGNFHQVLGVPAVAGRTLLPEDDRPGAAPVAVLSYRYWQKRFSCDPSVIGRTLSVNRLAVTIVGVTPPGFLGTILDGTGEDITLPLSLAPRIRRNPLYVPGPGVWWLRLVGRMKPGVSLEQTQAALEGVFQQSAREDLIRPEELPRLQATPGGQAKIEADRERDLGILMPMMGMAGLLLVAACANAATLLLARGARRRREIAVRLALGASRGRLVRQLLTESLLLGLLGAAAGLLFSRWNLDLLAMIFPRDTPTRDWLRGLRPDLAVVGFTVATAVLTGVLFGLVPALRATRLNLTEEFQGGVRAAGRGAMSRLSQTLVAVQVALCLMLLVGAGLFLRTLRNLGSVDLGFNPTHLLLFMVDGNGAGYKAEQFAHVPPIIAEQIGALPGVRSVSFAGWQMMSGFYGFSGPFSLAESKARSNGMPPITWNSVGPDFFETYGMPILAGRSFGRQDDAIGRKVAIVNQALAKKYFDHENPVGRSILLEGEREIVGVARDTKQTGRDLREPTAPMVFIPFAQSERGFSESARSLVFFTVRTDGAPEAMLASIRRAVKPVARDLPLIFVRTQEAQIQDLFLRERMFTWVAGFIGLFTLGLACVGLYGLISFTVFRRTSEIGVRMALGALPRSVLWMILRDSLSIVFVGILIGIPAACAASQVLSSMFFGLSPTDPLTYGVVTLLLAGVAMTACWLPARRATHVDPVIALRVE
jgi:predicted permease